MFLKRSNKHQSFFEKKLRLVLKKHFNITPSKSATPIYRKAIMHKSYLSIKGMEEDNNERLEFLGDALLNSYTAEYLYNLMPNASEGKLTKIRSKIVSRRHLNQLAYTLEVNHLIYFAIKTRLIDSSLPGNTLEALLGAIYIDRKYVGLKNALDFVFQNHIDVQAIEREQRDYKSILFEWCQKEKKDLEFKLKKNFVREKDGKNWFIMELEIKNEGIWKGEGKSKKAAEREASKKFLEDRKII